MRLFPLFLKLKNRRCLVVGAGSVAESKITSLIDTGARVCVIAPEATPRIRSWARSGKIDWRPRRFRLSDLRSMFLVIAATSSTKLHEQVFRGAQRFGVLCNVVDVPELCDFYYPAVLRRGALQIAVSTAGHSPALAQRLRKKLERQFAPQYADWLASVGRAREQILGRTCNAEERKQLLHALVTEKAFQQFRKRREGHKRRKT